MPKGTYENPITALKNSKKLMKKTGCDAIKIESNKRNFDIIKKLVSKKIPVMGHIGFTPQFKKFSVEGTTRESAKIIERSIKN